MAQRRCVATPAAAAGAGAGNDDVQGAMLEPSVVNTPWVRQKAVKTESLAELQAIMRLGQLLALVRPSTGSSPAWAPGTARHTTAWGMVTVAMQTISASERTFGRAMFHRSSVAVNIIILDYPALAPVPPKLPAAAKQSCPRLAGFIHARWLTVQIMQLLSPILISTDK
jgi:hypothetical protein